MAAPVIKITARAGVHLQIDVGAEDEAIVDEVLEAAFVLENPHEMGFRDPHPEPSLQRGHPHEGILMGSGVNHDALAAPAAGHKDLAADLTEDRVPGGFVNHLPCRWLRRIEPLERTVRHLAGLGPLLVGAGGVDSGNGHKDRQHHCGSSKEGRLVPDSCLAGQAALVSGRDTAMR